MKWKQRTWVGCTVTVALGIVLLIGCAKRPEVVEPAAKPIAPQDGVGMAAPKGITPEEKSPTEVAAQPSEAEVSREVGAVPETQIAEAEVKPETSVGVKAPELALQDIYFDFDQSSIREDSKKPLNENIEWLRKIPAAKVTIEGHCDERGSSEYNLALGERRARATRDYLVAAGVEANRIGTISFGKERPFAPGHDESAWQLNRRAHFALSAK